MKTKLVLILITSFFLIGIVIGQVLLPRTDKTITLDSTYKTILDIDNVETGILSCDDTDCYFDLTLYDSNETLSIKRFNEKGIEYTNNELETLKNNKVIEFLENKAKIMIASEEYFERVQNRIDKLGGGTITVNSK